MGIIDHLRTTIHLTDDRDQIIHRAEQYMRAHGITDIINPVTAAVWEPEMWFHTVDFWEQVYRHCQDQLNPTVSSWILLHLLRASGNPASRTDF